MNIISLGVGCGVSVYLNKLSIRTIAYPFDFLWVRTLKNLHHILSDDFVTLMNKDLHIKINQTDPNRIHNKFYDDLSDDFNSTFAHHNILDSNVFDTYKRRIERFISIKNEKNIFVTFIIDYKNDYTDIIKDYESIPLLMINKGYVNSKFILLIIRKGANSCIEKISESDTRKIYLFTYINTYGCGSFEGIDEDIIINFFITLLQ